MSDRLQQNLREIQQRVAAAAERGGRDASDVRLVAVTKYVEPEVARQLAELGCLDLGESRPQELWRKFEAVEVPDVRWHMIGHLQRNKANRTLPMVWLFQACDSLRLLSELQRLSESTGQRTPVLLEVNISGDAAKHGFAPEEMEAVLDEVSHFGNLEVRGLMAMAGLAGGSDSARADFARLATLRERLMRNCPPSVSLKELSMGMSRDFELAIEEGATIVRVGSAFFEGIES